MLVRPSASLSAMYASYGASRPDIVREPPVHDVVALRARDSVAAVKERWARLERFANAHGSSLRLRPGASETDIASMAAHGRHKFHRVVWSALLVISALLGAHCSASSNIAEPTDDLWGFADLHAHPAFHLAYGATVADASDLDAAGIMYGLPGLALDAGTEDADLKGCDGTSHSSSNPLADILLTQLSIVLKTPHGPSGYPSFDNWPGATAGLHQQMHVTWLKRAFDGGQRLMVASVVENALLAAVYSGRLNVPASPNIHVDERKSVDAQVDYVKRLVAANSDWLMLATSSDEAHTAIKNNKMAIVLGTEFDTLDLQEMNELWDAGVRVFIPIHLADNDLGGTAVYTDIFNLHNAYVRGVGYEIAQDTDLKFELGLDIPPIELLGLPLPNPFNNANVGVQPGHRNKKGLSDAGTDMIHALIDKGAIIDVAHMGEQSTDDTLSIAEKYKLVPTPVMDSHTSVRPDPKEAKGQTERDLSLEGAQRIGKLGGMIGMSTGGNTSDENISPDRIFYQTPFAKITHATPNHEESLPTKPSPHAVCKGLVFQAWTADDDLREAASLTVNGTSFFINQVPKQDAFTIHNDESITRMIPLPDGTMAADVDVDLEHKGDGNFFELPAPDQWNIGGIRLVCGPRVFEVDTSSQFDSTDAISMNVATTDATMISMVPIDIWAHDDLDSQPIDVLVHTKSGVAPSCPDVLAKPGGGDFGISGKTLRHIVCVLPSPVAMNDIDTVSLHQKGAAGKTVDAWSVGLDDGALPSAILFDQSYAPPLQVKDQSQTLASHQLNEAMVRIDITTAAAGLELGVYATATLTFSDTTKQTVPLNRGAALTAGRLDVAFKISVPIETMFEFYAPLESGHSSSDITSIRIDAPNMQGDWPITGVVLEAFKEPALQWVDDLDAVTTTLARGDCFTSGRLCGVALGTDLNGLAPAIPGTTISPYDPMQPGKFILDYPPELGGHGTITGLGTTGTKTWDVMRDGIAHVGLLPDFLVAAAHVPRPSANANSAARTVSTIFHSAGDFYRMWQKIEAAARAPKRML